MTDLPAVEVTVELGANEVVAGTLRFHRRRKTSTTFTYHQGYLENAEAYGLDPQLPLVSGSFQTVQQMEIFNFLSDSAPDRWGRKLVERQERDRAANVGSTARSLGAADFLLHASDRSRQGAVRLRDPDTGQYWSTDSRAIPKEVELAKLLRASDSVEDDDEIARQDLQDLVDAGSSLGGARPKAAIVNARGRLTIAKFPRKGTDDWDVMGWEKVALDLAARSGVSVPISEIVFVNGRRVLLVERFDRRDSRRLGYVSAMTMLEAVDGDHRTYPEIVEAVEPILLNTAGELEQLFRRIAFSVLISNTDDHLRNHGFLRTGNGWTLSPAFDLNPNPAAGKKMATGIEFGDFSADLQLLVDTAPYYRLKAGRAMQIISEVEAATRGWVDVAGSLGLPGKEVKMMTAAFETDQRKAARSFGPI